MTPALRAAVLPAAVAAAAVAVALAYVAAGDWGWGLVSAYTRSDAYLYAHKAWMQAFVDPSGGLLATVVPVSPYVALLRAAMRICGAHPVVPHILNGLLFALAAAATALTARRLFDAASGAVAGALFVLTAPLVFFVGLSMKTILVVALVALGTWAAVVFLDGGRRRWLALAALALAVAAADRNNLWLAPLVLLAATAVRRRADGTRRTRAWALDAATVVPLAGAVLGLSLAAAPPNALPASPMGLNFYVGNAPDSRGTYTPIPGAANDLIGQQASAVEIAEQMAGRRLSGRELSRYWLRRSLDYYGEHPGAFMALQLRKLGMLFSREAPGLPEQWSIWRGQRPLLWLTFVDLGILLALGLPGIGLAVRAAPRRAAVQLPVALAAVYGASVAAFFVTERFRLPLAVWLAPFAAWTLVTLVRRRDERLRVGLGLAALGIFGASWALTALHPHGAGWAADPQRAATAERTRQDDDRAIVRLKLQAARAPTADVWYLLSLAYAERRFWPDAIAFAERAIDLAPNRALGYRALVDAYAPLGRTGDLVRLQNQLGGIVPANASEARALAELRERLTALLGG